MDEPEATDMRAAIEDLGRRERATLADLHERIGTAETPIIGPGLVDLRDPDPDPVAL